MTTAYEDKVRDRMTDAFLVWLSGNGIECITAEHKDELFREMLPTFIAELFLYSCMVGADFTGACKQSLKRLSSWADNPELAALLSLAGDEPAEPADKHNGS